MLKVAVDRGAGAAGDPPPGARRSRGAAEDPRRAVRGVEREAAALRPSEDLAAAEAFASYGARRRWRRPGAQGEAGPGPRHPRNREAISRPPGPRWRGEHGSPADIRQASGGRGGLVAELRRGAGAVPPGPELHGEGERLEQQLLAYASQAVRWSACGRGHRVRGGRPPGGARRPGAERGEELSLVRGALSSLEPLLGSRRRRQGEGAQVRAGGGGDPPPGHHRLRAWRARRSGDPYEALSADARRLGSSRTAGALSPTRRGSRRLLAPWGRRTPGGAGDAAFARIGEYARRCRRWWRTCGGRHRRQEGLSSAATCWRRGWPARPDAGARAHLPAACPRAILSGEAYAQYAASSPWRRGRRRARRAVGAGGAACADAPRDAVRLAAVREACPGGAGRPVPAVGYLRAWLSRSWELPARSDPRPRRGGARLRPAGEEPVPDAGDEGGELLRLQRRRRRWPATRGRWARAPRAGARAAGVGDAFSTFSRKLLEARANL